MTRPGGSQLVAMCCAVVFFCAPALAWAVGVQPQAFENKPLTSFPSLARGWGFFTALGPWATDHLVFRKAAVRGADAVSRTVFGEAAPQGQSNSGGPIVDRPGADQRSSGSPEVFPKVIEGKAGWLYFGYDIEGKCQPRLPLDTVFQQINELRRVVESSGRRFVLIVPPDKATMEPGQLPDSFAGKKCAQQVRDRFWSQLGPAVGGIDLRPGLAAAADRLRRPVYYPKDSHWTDDGALLMVRTLAETVRPGVTSTWVVRPGALAHGPGDLPPLVGATGDDTGQLYSLAPAGTLGNVRDVAPEFNPQPLHFGAPPGLGTVPQRVGVFADSFTVPAIRYYGASFTDVTVEHHDAIAHEPVASAQAMLDRDTIVVEIVERNLASGNSGLLDPGVIATLGQVLNAHPRR